MESPEFAQVKERKAVVRRPLAEVIRLQWRDILLSALVRMSEQAPFYLFITFVLTYGTRQLKLDRNELLTYTLIAAAIGLISVPLFWISVYIVGCAVVSLVALVAMRRGGPRRRSRHEPGGGRSHQP